MPKTPRKADSEVVNSKDGKKNKKGLEQDSPPPTVIKPKDLFKNVIEYEEHEAESRSGENDLRIFKETCSEIRKLMREVLELKLLPEIDDMVKKQIEEKRVEASLLFVTLKKLNRLDKLRLKKARDTTNDARQRVDTFHLQLENLLYEVFHLQKEVGKCHEFKSKDEDIELVSVEEFYQEAPHNISKPEVTRSDKHKLTLARLEWEFEQRKRLSEQCRNLEQTREKITGDISSKQKQLENLAPRLNAILEATRPLQEELNMPLERLKYQKELAALLPDPLYILYSQLKAYIEASDSSMQINIQGEMEDARQFGTKIKSSSDETLEDVDSDSDMDNDDELVNKRTATCSTQAKSNDSLLSRHPLRIVLSVDHVTITFSYLVTLNIVMVGIKSSLKEDQNGVLPAENLLSGLFPDDYGDESPNIANGYQSKTVGHNQLADLGKPYLWAQRLAGLDFCSAVKSVPKSFVNSSYVDQVIDAIRNRVTNRLQLNQLLSNLGKGNIPLTADANNFFPASISTRLVSWNPIDYEECHKMQSAVKMLTFTEVNPRNVTLFRAVLQRDSGAKLNVIVILPMDYPNATPLFSLELEWHGKFDRESSEEIRQMEAEVNIFCEELPSANKNDLLAEQLKKLCLQLDLLTEIDGQLLTKCRGSYQFQLGKPEYPTEKMIPILVKGHDRSRPFKYDAKTQFFLHR